MKKIIAFAALMMIMSGAFAQDAISKYFSKYQTDETFQMVNISSRMFGLFMEMESDDPEFKEMTNIISKLKGLKIVAKNDTRDARDLYKNANSLVAKDYEELMTVRDEDKDMRFMIKESGGKISELVMVMGGNSEFMVMSLFGEIDLKQVSRLGTKMNVKGLENLQKMDSKDTKETKKPAPNSKQN